MDPLHKRWIIAIAISSLALAFRKQILENIHKTTTSIGTRPGKFDYYTLSFTWPPAICKERNGKHCNTPVPNSDFTIHGLWPSNRSGKGPSFCSPAPEFDPSKLDEISVMLKEHWPGLFMADPSVCFWSYQWKKHGTCAGTKQLKYFETTLRLWDDVNILGKLDYLKYKPDPTKKYDPKQILRRYKREFGVGLIIKCVTSTSGDEMIAEIQVKVKKDGKTVDSFKPKTNCRSSKVLFPNE